jgi:uncharacterized protein (TIGR03000 family)
MVRSFSLVRLALFLLGLLLAGPALGQAPNRGNFSGRTIFNPYAYAPNGYYSSPRGFYVYGSTNGSGPGPAYGSYGRTVPPYLEVPLGPRRLAQVPPPPEIPGAARVEVILPDPDAELVIDGRKSSKLGRSRSFESPKLEPGKTVTYEIRATWTEGGQTVTQDRKVTLIAGDSKVVDFTRPEPK